MLLSDYDLTEITEITAKFSQAAFRAKQLYKWVQSFSTYDEMTDLPKSFKDDLKNAGYIDIGIKAEKVLKSTDGSEKYLFRLTGGATVESVYMPHDYGDTVCVSTQAGCRMGCAFCASTIGGLDRNLTSGEILSQILYINKEKSKQKNDPAQKRVISNIVLMGSGEPLDNYDNVVKFIKTVSDKNSLNISRRSISLSTCGLCDKITALADENLGVTLSISLHATTDETRQELMPIAKKYDLKTLTNAAKYYFDKTGRRIIFEYALIKDKNMSYFDTLRLKDLTKNMSAHINLIMLNHVKESPLRPCTPLEADRFLQKLLKANLSATLRKSAASDIAGACGQLRNKFVGRTGDKK